MIPTDMLYFAVAREQHDGGVEVTRVAQSEAVQRHEDVPQEAFPLSGEAGISDIRDMIANDRLPAPAAQRGTVTTRN